MRPFRPSNPLIPTAQTDPFSFPLPSLLGSVPIYAQQSYYYAPYLGSVGIVASTFPWILVSATDASQREKAQTDSAYQCDGTADEVQIQAAIDAMPSTGGIIFLSSGTFNIAANITINVSNVFIVGTGNTSTTLKAQTGCTRIFSLGGTTAVARVGIKSMYLHGNNNTDGVVGGSNVVANVVGIWASQPSAQTNELYLEDLMIDSCHGGGLQILGVGNSWISHITGSYNGNVTGSIAAFTFDASSGGTDCSTCTVFGIDAEASNYAAFYIGPGAQVNDFYTLMADAGAKGGIGIIVGGGRNNFFGSAGISSTKANGGNKPFISFPDGLTSPRQYLNNFFGVTFEYDSTNDASSVINIVSTSGNCYGNNFVGVAVRILPTGTTLYTDTNTGQGNAISNVWVPTGQGGTLYSITQPTYDQVTPTTGLNLLTYGANVNTNGALAYTYLLSVTNTTAFTMKNPTNSIRGRQYTFDISNESGGVMGTITWEANFKLAGAFTNPANGKHRTITFYSDNTAWWEMSRAAADI